MISNTKYVQYDFSVYDDIREDLNDELKHYIGGSGYEYVCAEPGKSSLVLYVDYHCMNEDGYYDGYLYLRVIIPVFKSQGQCLLMLDHARIQQIGTGNRKYMSLYRDEYLEEIMQGVKQFFAEHYINHRDHTIVAHPMSADVKQTLAALCGQPANLDRSANLSGAY